VRINPANQSRWAQYSQWAVDFLFEGGP
jgi:hypothetical protein